MNFFNAIIHNYVPSQSIACHVPDVFNTFYHANVVFGSLFRGNVGEILKFCLFELLFG